MKPRSNSTEGVEHSENLKNLFVTCMHKSYCTKLNSKWIKHLNITPNTLTLAEEELGNILELTGTGKDFLSRTTSVLSLKSEINQWNFVKKKNLHTAKDTIIKSDSLHNGKRFYQLHIQ
ncbi:hypothetical protein STEG23_002855 [Scotinomys teguina]